MKKIIGWLRGALVGLAFAGALVLALLHHAPKQNANPAEFVPISYHPYVTHAVGDVKSAKSS